MTTAVSKLTTVRRSLALAGALAALAVTSLSVAAPVSADIPSVAVRYDDLNLASDAGVSTLYRRISHAARAVCPEANVRDLGMKSVSERCQAEAITRAVQELNNPQLALVHAARSSHG